MKPLRFGFKTRVGDLFRLITYCLRHGHLRGQQIPYCLNCGKWMP